MIIAALPIWGWILALPMTYNLWLVPNVIGFIYVTRTMGAVRIDKYKEENDKDEAPPWLLLLWIYDIDEASPPENAYQEYMIWKNSSSDYAYYENMIWIKPHPLTTSILNIWFGWSLPPPWLSLFWIYYMYEASYPLATPILNLGFGWSTNPPLTTPILIHLSITQTHTKNQTITD